MKHRWLQYFFWIVFTYATIEGYRQFINCGIKKNTAGVFQKLNEIFDGKTPYDVLIVGSSRAESHISPTILDSALGVNSFNIGIPGAYIHQQLAFLKAYLAQHPKPKTILLSADIYGYKPATDYRVLSDYNRYFPYLNHSEFYEAMRKIDSRFFYYKYIAPYSLSFDKQDENLNHALRGYFGYQKQTLQYTKGFAFSPFANKALSPNSDSILPYKCQVPQIIWEAYAEMHHLCQAQDIQLIVVLTPIHRSLYQKIENAEQITASLKQIFNPCPLLDYSQSPFGAKNDLYIDPVHLNKNGALKFSRALSYDLQQFLDKKNVK